MSLIWYNTVFDSETPGLKLCVIVDYIFTTIIHKSSLIQSDKTYTGSINYSNRTVKLFTEDLLFVTI